MPFLWQNPGGDESGWCIGGNRSWLSPEFSISGSSERGLFEDNYGSWRVPPGLDPGPYRTTRVSDTEWIGATSVSLSDPHMSVELRRRILIGPALDRELTIRVDTDIRNADTHRNTREIGLWVITQVPQFKNARIIVPLRDGAADGDTLWNPREGIPADRDISVILSRDSKPAEVAGPRIEVRVQPDQRFKIGVSPTWSDGRVEYSRVYDGGPLISIQHRPMRSNAGSGERYLDYGDIVQVFNSNIDDDGARFAEIETHWPGGALPPGASARGTMELIARTSR